MKAKQGAKQTKPVKENQASKQSAKTATKKQETANVPKKTTPKKNEEKKTELPKRKLMSLEQSATKKKQPGTGKEAAKSSKAQPQAAKKKAEATGGKGKKEEKGKEKEKKGKPASKEELKKHTMPPAGKGKAPGTPLHAGGKEKVKMPRAPEKPMATHAHKKEDDDGDADDDGIPDELGMPVNYSKAYAYFSFELLNLRVIRVCY